MSSQFLFWIKRWYPGKSNKIWSKRRGRTSFIPQNREEAKEIIAKLLELTGLPPLDYLVSMLSQKQDETP